MCFVINTIDSMKHSKFRILQYPTAWYNYYANHKWGVKDSLEFYHGPFKSTRLVCKL